MKALYITSKPIFPTVDGGSVAMEKFMSSLIQADLSVKHLIIETHKHKFNKGAYPDRFYQKTNPESIRINTKVTILGALLNLFKSGSYNVDRFHDRRMETLIHSSLEKENFDAVIFDSLFTTSYLESVRSKFKGKIFIRTHNVEFDLWKGYAEDAKGIKRWYLNKLAADIEIYELITLQQCDGILSISSMDSTVFRNNGISVPIHNISVAVQVPDVKHDYSNNRLYHLGAMDWIPNQEAVQRLMFLMPKVRKELPNTEIHIAGLNANKYVSSDEANGIQVHGFVQKIISFGIDHGILVTPIQSGSGIRIKILEAMAVGIPVLTTSIGAQGINHQDSECLLVADSDEDFVQSMIRLVKDEGLRQKIGRNAIDYIRKNHTIEEISEKLVEILKAT
ncbi:MAG: glycosyltransferase involved in cell wall biosynthesis [Flavobacteriaceae bacterium]|jgi:glycosyltransferase involved in cell wall biosynthesis